MAFTDKQKMMLKSLEENFGIVLRAVKVLKKNGYEIGRQSHYRWYEQNSVYKTKVDNIQNMEHEAKADLFENNLINLSLSGNASSTIYGLKCLGKKRGYGEPAQSNEINPLNIDYSKLSDQQIEMIFEVIKIINTVKK